MHNHNKCVTPRHTNAFLELNGVPYLVAEYLDRDTFQQIDRSLIRSDILIDQSEAMRAVVDIAVDDIGMRCSDGLPAVVGNNTKQKNLIKAIGNYAEQFNHQLMTVKRGILLRVNYSLENMRTGETIRSTVEDFTIKDRSYFLDINPRDLNDNAIVVNFSSSMVSTMTSFTHGTDQMVLRINEVQMFYEALGNGPNIPRPKMVMTDFHRLPTTYMDSFSHYQYQMEHQNHHCWDPHHVKPTDWSGNYGREPVDMISPSGWSMFNRYYHFDNGGKDIILHNQEINDPMAPLALVPCGKIKVNRSFMINPGHRIIFKFCIWKNDAIVVNDSTMIARAIKTPFIADCFDDYTHHDCNCGHEDIPLKPPYDGCGCDHEIEPDKETILRMLAESRRMNNKQNFVINQLAETVENLNDIVKNMSSCKHECSCGHEHVDKDENGKCDICDRVIDTDPITNDVMIIDGESYENLQDALKAIKEGSEIILQKDITDGEGDYIQIPSNVTLDLNNHTISGTYKNTTLMLNNSTGVVIKNGTIINVKGSEGQGNGITLQKAQATLIDVDVKTNGTFGIQVGVGAQGYFGKLELTDCNILQADGFGAGIGIYGPDKSETSGEKSILKILGNSTIIGTGYGIMGNGSAHNTEIELGEDVIVAGTDAESGSVGLYHPQTGTLKSDADISGYDSGIEVRSGTITINGGLITSMCPEFSCNPNGNGTTTKGAAIAVAQHKTKKDITITINDGIFRGRRSFNESNPQQNDPAPRVAMMINGGQFNGEVYVEDGQKFIYGGKFDTDVNGYLADEREQNPDGTVVTK